MLIFADLIFEPFAACMHAILNLWVYKCLRYYMLKISEHLYPQN